MALVHLRGVLGDLLIQRCAFFKSLAIISSKFYFIYQALPAKLCDIVILTTWEPRKCGIATYSDALRTALKSVCPPDSRVDIIAAKYRDESNDNFNSSVVKGAVRDLEFHDLIRAGKLVNSRQYHAILVQYEFGMLYGDALMCMLRSLRTPVIIVTQHTVTSVMWEYQHSLMREMHYLADRSIVMTEAMRYTMNAFHGISPYRITVIPHGIPELDIDQITAQPEDHFLRLRYPNTTIVMSNGLIHTYKVATI